MTRSKLATVSIAAVVVLGFVVPLLALGSGSVGANHAGDPDVRTYHAEQDDRCVTLSPLGDGQETVTEFYDYDPTYNGNYSSQGTDHLQERQVSQFFVHHGPDGASLVFLHDSLEWDDEGGAISMTITGLPSDGEWAVEDDDYGNDTDDNWVHNDTRSEIDWMWGEGRSDGGAFQGLEHLESGERIHVDPAFSEESFAYQERSPTWPYAEDNVTWHARDGDGDLVSLDENQEVRIGPGTCEITPPEAYVTTNTTNVSTGESVTLDASGSYDESEIDAYHWDVNDDGEVTETTEDATYSHSYSTPGTHTAAVTVTDEDGQNTTATTTVDVTDGTPPVARASANRTSVEVGDSVTFNGSRSTDNGEITDFQWEFGDGEGAANATASHTYTTPGTYDAELTVSDAEDNVNQTTVTVTVARDEPVATLTAPETVMPDENATFDASGSSDSDGIDEYRWDVDDDGTPDRTTTDSTLSWGFAAAGDHPVSVTVVDGDGNTNTTSTTVTVVDTTPTAVVSSNETNVTVGSPVSFDASGSTNATDYGWEFGDGETATGETATHTYDDAGTYEATLTASDDDGDENSTTRTITVEEGDDDESDDDDGSEDESDDDENDGDGSDGDEEGDEDESDDDNGDGDESDDENDGNENTGDENDGNENTGDENDGNENTGDENDGNENTGNENDGNENTGDENDGDENDGDESDRETGDNENDSTDGDKVDEDERVSGGSSTGGSSSSTDSNDAPSDNDESTISPEANIELADVTVERTRIPTGGSVSAVATFENTGSAAGTASANFSVVDDVVAVERTTVAPGETATLRFNESLDSPGNYTVAVNGEQQSVTVGEGGTRANGSEGTPVEASADGERGTTGLAVAGLGALVVLAAVLNRLV